MARGPPPPRAQRQRAAEGPGCRGTRWVPHGGPRRLRAGAPAGAPPRRPTRTALTCAPAALLENARLGHWTLAGLVPPLSDWIPGCMLADVLCAGLPAAPRLLVPVCLLPAACLPSSCVPDCRLPVSRPAAPRRPRFLRHRRPASQPTGARSALLAPLGGRQRTLGEGRTSPLADASWVLDPAVWCRPGRGTWRCQALGPE